MASSILRAQAAMGRLSIDIASECPHLLFLSSIVNEKRFSYPREGSDQLEIPSSFKPKLEDFVWDNPECNMVCNEHLLQCLQGAKGISLACSGPQPAWVIKLLSSTSSSLITVILPFMSTGFVEEIPLSDLPNLELLYLANAPESTERDSSLFFKQLQASNLTHLQINTVSPEALSFLRQDTSPQSFQSHSLAFKDSESAPMTEKELAASFVKSRKHWKYLDQLVLQFQGSEIVWNEITFGLSINSRENIRAGLKDHPFLPQLTTLSFGDGSKRCEGVSEESLISLVGSKFAKSKGFGSARVAFAADGGLENLWHEMENDDDEDKVEEEFASLGSIELNMAYNLSEKTRNWLNDHECEVVITGSSN